MARKPRIPEKHYKFMINMRECDHRRLRVFATARDLEYGAAVVLLLDIFEKEMAGYERLVKPKTGTA